MEEWKIEHWEGDEYVITNNTGVIGETLNKRRAESILLWLKTSGL